MVLELSFSTEAGLVCLLERFRAFHMWFTQNASPHRPIDMVLDSAPISAV